MVLHGIGGRSIREAKENLSVSEVHQWALYFQQRGLPSRKLDRGFALLGHLLCTGLGVKIGNKTPSMDDLMPKPPEKPRDADIDEVFALFKSVAKHGNP